MISNIEPYCCRQCSCPNKCFYVQVQNSSHLYIYVLLQYSINGKTILKPNPLFGPNKTQRVSFPSNALDLSLSIYNCFYNPPLLICSTLIPNTMSSCFMVAGTTEGTLQCIPVKC